MSTGTGPWSEDARRLFQMFQAAAERAGPLTEDEHPPECRYCPFCQGVALLRRAGPDVLDVVSEFAAGLAASLRDESAGDPPPAPAEPPSTVRIDVTD